MYCHHGSDEPHPSVLREQCVVYGTKHTRKWLIDGHIAGMEKTKSQLYMKRWKKLGRIGSTI